MNARPPQRLLIDALLLPLPQAGDAWREWRVAIDAENLDPGSVRLVPALAGRLPAWLANDPRQAMFLGICKQAWTRNQLRRKVASDAVKAMNAAGIARVAATGSLQWGTRYWPEGAIRPLARLDLLVEPASVRGALDALTKAGWTPAGKVPDTTRGTFYFAPGVPLRSSSGDEVRLHWRALPNSDLALRRPVFPAFEAVPPGGVAPYEIPVEHALVAALGGSYDDEIAWQCDALLICRDRSLAWEKVAELLRWRTKARNRLDELRREWGAPVSAKAAASSWTAGLARPLAAALRFYRRRRV